MTVRGIRSEYLAAEAASLDPSDMLAAIHLMLISGLFDVVVRASHSLVILLLFYFSPYFCDLFRHVAGNPDSPYPAIGSGMESNGLVIDLKIYAEPEDLPSVILVKRPCAVDLLRS